MSFSIVEKLTKILLDSITSSVDGNEDSIHDIASLILETNVSLATYDINLSDCIKKINSRISNPKKKLDFHTMRRLQEYVPLALASVYSTLEHKIIQDDSQNTSSVVNNIHDSIHAMSSVSTFLRSRIIEKKFVFRGGEDTFKNISTLFESVETKTIDSNSISFPSDQDEMDAAKISMGLGKIIHDHNMHMIKVLISMDAMTERKCALIDVLESGFKLYERGSVDKINIPTDIRDIDAPGKKLLDNMGFTLDDSKKFYVLEKIYAELLVPLVNMSTMSIDKRTRDEAELDIVTEDASEITARLKRRRTFVEEVDITKNIFVIPDVVKMRIDDTIQTSPHTFKQHSWNSPNPILGKESSDMFRYMDNLVVDGANAINACIKMTWNVLNELNASNDVLIKANAIFKECEEISDKCEDVDILMGALGGSYTYRLDELFSKLQTECIIPTLSSHAKDSSKVQEAFKHALTYTSQDVKLTKEDVESIEELCADNMVRIVDSMIEEWNETRGSGEGTKKSESSIVMDKIFIGMKQGDKGEDFGTIPIETLKKEASILVSIVSKINKDRLEESGKMGHSDSQTMLENILSKYIDRVDLDLFSEENQDVNMKISGKESIPTNKQEEKKRKEENRVVKITAGLLMFVSCALGYNYYNTGVLNPFSASKEHIEELDKDSMTIGKMVNEYNELNLKVKKDIWLMDDVKQKESLDGFIDSKLRDLNKGISEVNDSAGRLNEKVRQYMELKENISDTRELDKLQKNLGILGDAETLQDRCIKLEKETDPLHFISSGFKRQSMSIVGDMDEALSKDNDSALKFYEEIEKYATETVNKPNLSMDYVEDVVMSRVQKNLIQSMGEKATNNMANIVELSRRITNTVIKGDTIKKCNERNELVSGIQELKDRISSRKMEGMDIYQQYEQKGKTHENIESHHDDLKSGLPKITAEWYTANRLKNIRDAIDRHISESNSFGGYVRFLLGVARGSIEKEFVYNSSKSVVSDVLYGFENLSLEYTSYSSSARRAMGRLFPSWMNNALWFLFMGDQVEKIENILRLVVTRLWKNIQMPDLSEFWNSQSTGEKISYLTSNITSTVSSATPYVNIIYQAMIFVRNTSYYASLASDLLGRSFESIYNRVSATEKRARDTYSQSSSILQRLTNWTVMNTAHGMKGVINMFIGATNTSSKLNRYVYDQLNTVSNAAYWVVLIYNVSAILIEISTSLIIQYNTNTSWNNFILIAGLTGSHTLVNTFTETLIGRTAIGLATQAAIFFISYVTKRYLRKDDVVTDAKAIENSRRNRIQKGDPDAKNADVMIYTNAMNGSVANKNVENAMTTRDAVKYTIEKSGASSEKKERITSYFDLVMNSTTFSLTTNAIMTMTSIHLSFAIIGYIRNNSVEMVNRASHTVGGVSNNGNVPWWFGFVSPGEFNREVGSVYQMVFGTTLMGSINNILDSTYNTGIRAIESLDRAMEVIREKQQ